MTFQLISHEIQKTLKKENLTLPQLDILVCLGRSEGLTLGEIGERLLVTGGNITGVMDRLEKSGYVYRDRDKSDRRIIRAKLTPKGLSLHKEILPIFKKKWNEIVEILTPEEQRQLNRLLKKFSRGLLAMTSYPRQKTRERNR
ncbi:MAG: MarR family transcriptional regulator [Desulfobacterota bacterium]|nr:MarR family transcriptional regulator [Thermodesulfobacteriota bacterium]